MSQDILSDFTQGNSISQTAERTQYRSARRLRERHLLRRERLHRVLHLMGFLPKHYDETLTYIRIHISCCSEYHKYQLLRAIHNELFDN
jgi:CRISPR-associated endonuclease Csn1